MSSKKLSFFLLPWGSERHQWLCWLKLHCSQFHSMLFAVLLYTRIPTVLWSLWRCRDDIPKQNKNEKEHVYLVFTSWKWHAHILLRKNASSFYSNPCRIEGVANKGWIHQSVTDRHNHIYPNFASRSTYNMGLNQGISCYISLNSGCPVLIGFRQLLYCF
jgi:hypothetical protein